MNCFLHINDRCYYSKIHGKAVHIRLGHLKFLFSLSAIDENGLLPHLLGNCQHIPNVQQLAFTIAGRYNLPGVDNIFMGQFNNFIVNGDYQNAAKIASMSPGTLLRNEQTIQKFKGFPQMPGQPQPLLIYFQKLLERGKLNKLETLELCGPVLAQGKIDLVRTWAANNKLEPCVELGDLVGKLDKTGENPSVGHDFYHCMFVVLGLV